MLVHGAAGAGTSGHSAARLFQPGRAVDNEELGRAQAAGDQVVEDAAPCGLAVSAHVAHGQEQLLPIYFPIVNVNKRLVD